MFADCMQTVDEHFFILDLINCSNNSKLLAVILVKFLKRAQLSILTSPRMFNFFFRLSRKLAAQWFQLRSLLCPIIMTAAAIATDCSAFENILRHTNDVPLNNM
jgi:hypothetical protein